MKSSSAFKAFTGLALFAILMASCTKLSTGVSPDVSPDSSYPLEGNWVLQFTDDGNGNNHIDYPQDGTTDLSNGTSVISWASHLLLLPNDSAYWNSSGLDALPVWFSKGTYFLSTDVTNQPAITLSFAIDNDSTFEYAFKGMDTLVLDSYTNTHVFFTYLRK